MVAGILIYQAHSQTLTFNRVLLVDALDTVPAGMVWKVESVFMTTEVANKYSASSGSGSCVSPCNGSNTKWTSFTTSPLPVTSFYGLVVNGSNYVNVNFPVWLPECTTVVAKGPTENCYSNAGCYNNFCPPAAFSVTGVMTVIEFSVP